MLASDKMYHNYSHMVQHLGAICGFFYLNSGHDWLQRTEIKQLSFDQLTTCSTNLVYSLAEKLPKSNAVSNGHLFKSANKRSYSIFFLQQQAAFTQGPFFHLPWGMLLHSSVPQTAGRPWRNGLNHAIKKKGQNTWNLLFSLLTPRAPLFSPCTCLSLSHPCPLPPFCSTAHTVYECINRSISPCPTPSSLPTPQPLLSPHHL